MKLTVLGAAGRMGRALINAIDEHTELELSAAVDRQSVTEIGMDSGVLAGIGTNSIPITSDIAAAISTSDGIVDFTSPANSVETARIAGENGCIHIIGTTGFSEAEEDAIRIASKTATIVKSGNMSLGVNLLASLVEQAAKALVPEDFDIEVAEMHHKHKVDAPSGTALLLGEAAARGRDIDLASNSVRKRDGITGAREEGTIGFAALRGGGVIGEHTVVFASASERIELSHSALDRSLFAAGALRAALWASGKPNGLYSMKDVLAL